MRLCGIYSMIANIYFYWYIQLDLFVKQLSSKVSLHAIYKSHRPI